MRCRDSFFALAPLIQKAYGIKATRYVLADEFLFFCGLRISDAGKVRQYMTDVTAPYLFAKWLHHGTPTLTMI